MGSGAHGDVIGCDVDAYAETLLVDVGEMVARLFRILMSDIETDVVDTVNLHLLVDGTGNDIARSQ